MSTTPQDPHPAIGRSEIATDTLDLRQARHMQLALDQDPTLSTGDPLPPFWHYLYFNPQIKASELAEDGHARLGGFLPDLGLPRRMWAGGTVDLVAPLPLGAEIRKVSTLRDVTRKSGRSGALGFVTVSHDIQCGDQLCMTEVQNIVYRAPPAPGTPPASAPPAPETAQFSRKVIPDQVLLFRYSALIFYGHRIHYDADYTRDVEGYPGLIVHGPLTATMLIAFGMEHAAGRTLRRIEIRAMSPLFAPAPFWLEGLHEGGQIKLWARSEDGGCAMRVTLSFDA